MHKALRRWGLAAVAVAAVCASSAAQVRDAGQAPAAATGVVMGRVTLLGSGLPAEGVRVSLTGPPLAAQRSAVTDADGHYAFTALPAGTFTVRGTLPGYVGGAYGQRVPGGAGTPVVLLDGQQLRDVSFEVGKGGVLSGVVLDERGRPSISTPVRALRWMMQAGERVVNVAGTATTDDRGIYRIHSLPPGGYLVTVAPRASSVELAAEVNAQARLAELQALGLAQSGAAPVSMTVSPAASAEPRDAGHGYAAIYFPGTTVPAHAQTITVGVGDEHLGIDLALQRVPLSTITGHVLVPPGMPSTGVQVRLIQPDATMSGLGVQMARPAPDGTFTFRSIVPGAYTVVATAAQSSPREVQILEVPGMTNSLTATNPQRRLWASADVYVDGGQPVTVGLALQDGVAVRGQVVFSGALPLPARLESVRVTLNPVGQPLQSMGLGSVVTSADATGRFQVSGIVPGRYRVSASGAQGWQLASVFVDGDDVLDFPFVVEAGAPTPELTVQFTDVMASLRGSLTSAMGAPRPDHTVIVFPDDQRYWIPHARRMRAVRPATDGTFSFTGLPPGDYRLAAVTDVDTGEWLDPAFLRELLPASVGVRLTSGPAVTQDLRVR